MWFNKGNMWVNKGIIDIRDMTKESQQFLSRPELRQKMNLETPFTLYYKLVSLKNGSSL